MAVHGRRYTSDISHRPIREEEIVESLRRINEKGRGDILLIYMLLLASGVRYMHILDALKNWREDEYVYVDKLKSTIKRLECKEEVCRYYLGKKNTVKPAGFMYFPRILLPLIRHYAGKMPSRRWITKQVKKWGCLPPKYIRTYALRLMERLFGETDKYKFIVSRFSELSIDAKRYWYLVERVDEEYKKYIEIWLELINKALPYPGDYFTLVLKNNNTDTKPNNKNHHNGLRNEA